MAQRVHALYDVGERPQKTTNRLLGTAGDFAETDQTLVGSDLHQNQLRPAETFMRGPDRLRIVGRQRMGDDLGDLHADATFVEVKRAFAGETTRATGLRAAWCRMHVPPSVPHDQV